MLKSLSLRGVGPADEMELEFADRLNIITGDNGLVGTFLLDVVWWALTRTWAQEPAWPHRGRNVEPRILFRIQGKIETCDRDIAYDFRRQQWRPTTGRPPRPGVVVYARAGGGFSVWDPNRNYRPKLRSGEADDPGRQEAYHFHSADVWEGMRAQPDGYRAASATGSEGILSDRRPPVVCNGLIDDWVAWQRQRTDLFLRLSGMLSELAPGGDVSLRPSEPTRVRIDDVRHVPTIQMPYGDVPLTYASAGIRRICALAYILVWAWHEHVEAAKFLNRAPQDRMVLLFDEVETHLHPSWQRQLLPALLAVVDGLVPDGTAQVIASTHAPMVMASVESAFNPEKDRHFHLDLADGQVVVRDVPWAKQGDAVGWLTSEVFGLEQARSVEAERAIKAANAFMREDSEALEPGLRSKEQIHEALLKALPGHDPFWPRWIVHVDEAMGTGA